MAVGFVRERERIKIPVISVIWIRHCRVVHQLFGSVY